MGRLDTSGCGTRASYYCARLQMGGRVIAPLAPATPMPMSVLDVRNFFSPFEAILLALFIAHKFVWNWDKMHACIYFSLNAIHVKMLL